MTKLMRVMNILNTLLYLVMAPVTGLLIVGSLPEYPAFALAMLVLFILSVVNIFEAVSDFRKHKAESRSAKDC